MAFRVATVADVPAVAALQREFYAHEGYAWPVSESLLHAFVTDASLGRLLVDESLAAYAVLAFGYSFEFGGRDAFVDELYVAGHARGRGLGTEALRYAEEVAIAAGVRALHLEVEHGNESAKRLYARIGYEEHSRVLMTKTLAPKRLA
jgi:ribosomal protein S18 acetylase RimI-like enzyme